MQDNSWVRTDIRFYLARKRVLQIYCKRYNKTQDQLTEDDHKKIDAIVINDHLRREKLNG